MTIEVIVLGILIGTVALIAVYINKRNSQEDIIRAAESRGRVHDIMEAREELRKQAAKSDSATKDFKSELEKYNEKYHSNASGSSNDPTKPSTK